MHLVKSHVARDIETIATRRPGVWRSVRRFNRPVQLAVAAAMETLEGADDAADIALISLAPCQAGSPEIFAWVRKVNARTERSTPIRANPTHTLHAVDNLALSAVAMLVGSRGRGVGLGGAAGQMWEALEIASELATDALVFAGDQTSSEHGGDEVGVAALFRQRGQGPRLTRVARRAAPTDPERIVPHAAAGLIELLDALANAPEGAFSHAVPARHGDGQDDIAIEFAVAPATATEGRA